MKKLLCLVVLALCVSVPNFAFTEDRATVHLARTIYALAGQESYETKLAIGTVVVNRVDDPWFESDLEDVLSAQHQFPSGTRYDAESLQAAHEIISGVRTLPKAVLYYHALDASESWADDGLYATVGGYGFYTEN